MSEVQDRKKRIQRIMELLDSIEKRLEQAVRNLRGEKA